MVREAAEKASKDDIARLREIQETQRAALGNAEAFIVADMLLHTQIAVISGNPIYVAFSEAMLSWLKEYHTEMLIWTGKENITLSEHEEIIDCIARHDAGAAENAMIKHLERSRALYARNVAS
jgi:DNA-binding FadR family transcriptional regulator